MTPDHQEPGLPETEHSHTYNFYKKFQDYVCPIDPEWEPDIPFTVNVTSHISWNDTQLQDVLFKDRLNIIWVPMHKPTWQWFNDFYPDAWRDLEILADPYSEYPTAVVWDYNNETLFPGNFDPKDNSTVDILKDKDFREFYCSTLSWDRENILDKIGFRQIISNYSGMGGLAIFNTFTEDPSLQHGYKGMEIGKKYPIRYFCPNNVFRPNRAMGIVKMHHKGMLDDTEWSMNKFSQWHEMDRFIQEHDLDFLSYVKEYFDLFGKTPRQMSYPWNKEYNIDRINQDRGDHSMKHKAWYDAFPRSLMDKVYIYIAQQTVSSKTTEEPINPLKPYHVGDWDEKILKGFIYGKPTFINGRAGTLQILEDLGFDMLRDYNIHDYDSEQDDVVRIDKMLDCAINFPKANKDIQSRLEHNNRLVRSKKFWWDSQSNLIKILLDNHAR